MAIVKTVKLQNIAILLVNKCQDKLSRASLNNDEVQITEIEAVTKI